MCQKFRIIPSLIVIHYCIHFTKQIIMFVLRVCCQHVNDSSHNAHNDCVNSLKLLVIVCNNWLQTLTVTYTSGTRTFYTIQIRFLQTSTYRYSKKIQLQDCWPNPIQSKIFSQNFDPIQSNPIQSMDESNPWPSLFQHCTWLMIS